MPSLKSTFHREYCPASNDYSKFRYINKGFVSENDYDSNEPSKYSKQSQGR